MENLSILAKCASSALSKLSVRSWSLLLLTPTSVRAHWIKKNSAKITSKTIKFMN